MSTKLHIGSFTQLPDGVQAPGKILTLKTDDILVWATPPKGYVSITKLLNSDLSATLTNVPGPVTYQWSFTDANSGLLFTSVTNIATVSFVKNANTAQYQPFVMATAGTTAVYIHKYSALVKLIVFDVNGSVYSAYYDHSIEKSLTE